MSMFNAFISTLRQILVKTPQIQPVRHRYFKKERGYIRRYGYTDKLGRSGLLPHYGDHPIKELPTYK